MIDNAQDFVQYRLSRAFTTLEEAKILAERNHWNACANRLYYACFYAVSGLLFKKGLSSRKHSGVRSIFNRTLVQTGIISREFAALYNDLFEKRQEGDYEDFTSFEESDISPFILKTESFLNIIQSLIIK